MCTTLSWISCTFLNANGQISQLTRSNLYLGVLLLPYTSIITHQVWLILAYRSAYSDHKLTPVVIFFILLKQSCYFNYNFIFILYSVILFSRLSDVAMTVVFLYNHTSSLECIFYPICAYIFCTCLNTLIKTFVNENLLRQAVHTQCTFIYS